MQSILSGKSLRPVAHQHDQAQPIDDLAQICGDAVGKADKAQKLRQNHHKKRPDDRAANIPCAADQQCGQDKNGFIEIEAGRIDVCYIGRVDHTGNADKRAGDGECPNFECRDVSAQGQHGNFIIADALQDPAKRRMHELVENKDNRAGQNCTQYKKGNQAGNRNHAKELGRGDARNTVRPARHIDPVIQDRKHDQLKAQRRQHKVVAFQAQRGISDEQARDRRHSHDQQQRWYQGQL